MTSIIKLNVLSGALDESPPCYILQVDEFRFLLDCGWDEKFDLEFIKELKRHVNQIDAVLLTYPDIHHLGALPYLVGKCGLSCPIYATIPVYKMGQMFMYDLYQSRYNMEEFALFDLDDVDAAFDKIIQLKYNQSVTMKGKCYGLTIIPMPAGHMLGGTMWKIMKVGEEDIIYAVDFNHKKERHLNGCDLEKLQRPSILITDAFNATYQQARRRIRDEKLMTNILQTLRGHGNTLIAVDTAGRVLELAHMLDQLWRNRSSGLVVYSLSILNNVSYNVVEFAKSQIEWMSDKLMRTFEAQRTNPFQFKYITLCHSLTELNRIPGPKVVLASMPDMECGFARDLFTQWAQDPKNSIILTTRSAQGTLARDLLDNGINRVIKVTVKHRVKLDGRELEEYYLTHEKELINDKESSESEDEPQVLGVISGSHDLTNQLIKPEPKKRGPKYKKTYPMYPLIDQKLKSDEYGEIIKPEEYLLEGYADGDKESKRQKEEDITDMYEVPTKCVTYVKNIHLRAQVHYIDFEGRSDGESMHRIVAQLRPRNLILVRGTRENTEALANHVATWTDSKIFTPSKGDIVDATTESHIYQVRLTDSLVSSLKFQRGKNSELSWLNSVVTVRKKTQDTTMHDEDMKSLDEEESVICDDIYTLEPVQPCQADPHQPVFVNELKLFDLKQVFTKHHIDSEFSGGVLWCCNGTIAVKRMEAGKVLLEGMVSDQYYRIRDILYGQYAVL